MARIQISLDDDILDALRDHCARAVTTESREIGRLVWTYLNRQPDPAREHRDEPDTGAKVRLQVSLTPSEIEAIEYRAEVSGQRPVQWAARAIRGVLIGQPQLTPAETVVLEEAAEALDDLRAEVARLVKAVRGRGQAESPSEPIVPGGPPFDAWAAEVSAHVSAVRDVIASSRERWRIDG